MSKQPDVIWLNTSPSLECFSKPLLSYLSPKLTIQKWEYYQSLDEASSLNGAIVELYEHLKSIGPVHLIGHSTAGLLGLLYSRLYPANIKSLTLLAVGVDPAVDWQAHYYVHRQFMTRQKLLNTMVYNLFGYQDECSVKSLEYIIERDLDCSLSPHSLFKRVSLPPSPVPVPLMVCGSMDDIVVDGDALQAWKPFLKQGDRLWSCLSGRHFFHYFQYQLVAEQLLNFWNSLHLRDVLTSNFISAINQQ